MHARKIMLPDAATDVNAPWMADLVPAERTPIKTSDRPFGLPSDEALIEEFNRRCRDGDCRS